MATVSGVTKCAHENQETRPRQVKVRQQRPGPLELEAGTDEQVAQVSRPVSPSSPKRPRRRHREGAWLSIVRTLVIPTHDTFRRRDSRHVLLGDLEMLRVQRVA